MSKPETLGDQPIEDSYRAELNTMAQVVDEYFNGKDRSIPRKAGFVLMLFPFNNHEGRCNYISNAAREDIIVLLKEQLHRFEGGAFKEGHA